MYMIAGASEEKAEEFVRKRHIGESAGVLPNKIGSPIDPDEFGGAAAEGTED
jgi:PTS system galactitol-specific IIC component